MWCWWWCLAGCRGVSTMSRSPVLALTLAADWAEAADPDWGRLYMLVTPECSEGVLCRRCREEEDAVKRIRF